MTGAGIVVLGGTDLVQQLFDTILAGDRFVKEERELWHTPEPETRADLSSQERRGPVERAPGALTRAIVPERRVIHTCLLDVWAHLDARQRHEPYARVVHFSREELGEFASNLIRHTIWS
jgi:hypothetical protein